MSGDSAQEVISQLERTIEKAQRVLDELRGGALNDRPGFTFGGGSPGTEAPDEVADPIRDGSVNVPVVSRRPQTFGHGAVNRIGDVVDGQFVANIMQGLGRFTRSELAEAMQVKPTVASKWITQFRSRACIDAREDDECGMVYLWRGGDIPLDPDLDIEEEEEPDPEPVTREQVRDFVVQTCRRTREPVGIGAVLTAVGGTAREVQPHIDWLIEKGIIEDVSPIEGAHLYDYVEADGPGPLAAASQERQQREALRTHASNQVPGTGKQALPSHPEARDLVNDLRRAGYVVERAVGGHWSVMHPDGTKMPMVPSTPSGRGAKDARARLKRAGARIP